MVGHLLAFPGGLDEAMSTLQARFGRPDLIVEATINKIRSMPPPKIEKMTTLVEFGLAVKRLVAAVKASGLHAYMYDVALLKELVRKLPPVTCIEWARTRKMLPEVSLFEFGRWIGELADDLCAVIDMAPATGAGEVDRRKPETTLQSNKTQSLRFQPHRPQPARPQPGQPTGTGRAHPAYLNATTVQGVSCSVTDPEEDIPAAVPACVLCDKSCKSLDRCDKFRKTSVAARRAFVNERKICRKCLSHHGGRCRVTTSCGVDGCGVQHHRLLHMEERNPNSPTSYNRRTESGNASNTGVVSLLAHTGTTEGALLKYVPVTLHGPGGRVDTYAFFDDGSTSTFMDHGLLAELGVSGTPHPLCLQWTGDVSREEGDSVRLPVQISGRGAFPTVHELAEVHTVKELALPAQSVDVIRLSASFPNLKGLPLYSYEHAVPRVLIGVDNCHLSQSLKTAEGKCDEPVASKTRLGWVVYAPCPVPARHMQSFHVCTCGGSSDDRLTAIVKEYFTLESIGIDKSSKVLESKDNERALAILERETKFKDDHYETGLLWRYDALDLPCNKAAAMKRYVCLKQKMRKDRVLAEAVNAKMREYLSKGYIKKLSDTAAIPRRKNDWFLPIFPVTNPNKPGKIRMVFDAAAKVRGVSLNSNLLSGPDLLAGLLSVLLKFRENRVAVAGDIREMFHQVGIKEADQRCQMILWDGDNPDNGPAVYVVTVMTFGAACSPSSAQYVKNLNARRFAAEYPRAVECIVHEHYVDDMLVSVETDEEAKALADAVRYIHSCGGFEIRNWISNSPSVVQHLQKEFRGKENINTSYDLSTEKVLGMWWDTASDTLTFRLSPKHDEDLLSGRKAATKREILRTLMSIYDPLGLLGHFLMYLKVLLQEVWRGGLGWDQKLDDVSETKWAAWRRLLPEVKTVVIPRCYRQLTSPEANVELHIFCDASENGTAAVAYFRFEENGQIECALVGSKTRVAPLKCLSIPRLELQAATIGARLAKTIVEGHRVVVKRTTYWTDSMNVLSWLHSDHRRYTQFVAFRVGELLESTNPE
ncbi:uncharacterized protein LOC125769448 [Anopheles funestus]|uniref:uncharacterized protein LOC125769448 n=1 Tax=Anopheles funestus TaxID=62324 RepID=UPI0020C5D0A3|nr:uncharacterized protein LOC125769448 [Anopheles funestus]